MPPPFAAISDIAAIVKANLSGWYMLLALLLFSILTSGCELQEDDELEGCFPLTGCVLEATAVKVTCGYGAFDDVWLLRNDGVYVQPWANATTVQQLVPGHKYKFGYEPIDKDNRYADLVICLAALPDAKTANITCLEPVSVKDN